MNLREYLDFQGLDAVKFSLICGIHAQTVRNILNGHPVIYQTFKKIFKATQGRVLVDISSRHKQRYKDKVKESYNKTHD